MENQLASLLKKRFDPKEQYTIHVDKSLNPVHYIYVRQLDQWGRPTKVSVGVSVPSHAKIRYHFQTNKFVVFSKIDDAHNYFNTRQACIDWASGRYVHGV